LVEVKKHSLTFERAILEDRDTTADQQPLPRNKFNWTDELSRLTRIEKAVKNTTIFVIYKVLVYIQMSQPTTRFGLFYLDHPQVGYLSQRKCAIVQYNHWSQGGGDKISFIKMGRVHKLVV